MGPCKFLESAGSRKVLEDAAGPCKTLDPPFRGRGEGELSKTLYENNIGGWGVGTEVTTTGKSVSVSVRAVRAGEAKLREFHP